MNESDRDDVLRQFSGRQKSLEVALASLKAYVESECTQLSAEDRDFQWRLVEGRVKHPDSAMGTLKKAESGPDELWDVVDDVIGVRAVVVSKQMAEKLRDRLDRADASPIKNRNSKTMFNEERGYRAIHVKGKLNTHDGEVGCEVQIRTELEDYWGVVTHSDLSVVC